MKFRILLSSALAFVFSASMAQFVFADDAATTAGSAVGQAAGNVSNSASNAGNAAKGAAQMKDTCKSDIEKFCSSASGAKETGTCLKDHMKDLSDQCRSFEESHQVGGQAADVK